MKYYHALYISEKLKKQKDEIIEKIEKNQWQLNKYIIALTKNEKNHLEFFDSVLLIQNALSMDDMFVVGIADGYQGALELVEQITEEVYGATQGVNIRTYIQNKQQEYEESRA